MIEPHSSTLQEEPVTAARDKPSELRNSVGKVIARLQAEYARPGSQPSAWAAASIATLRKSDPGKIENDRGAWPLIYASLPEPLLGHADSVTREERAMHATLVLYAIHQSSQPTGMHCAGVPLGRALRQLPGADDERSPILKRFTSLLSAPSFEAAMYHLRGLITLLRRERIGLDYVALCQDLSKLQNPSSTSTIRRRWGRDFFNNRSAQ
ncbi:type I-E CRISPR-associated protein Cse2/CasB [Dermatophilus congolensis]|uniref:type I-E CRISPR-associated protein Cse2/CasB n=1 Tax=Dermatophilus congolensis TaxID=1863 RepID=UPI001AAF90F2|nr:type I-E CRISPR-associated protein Cse2/CasB [Dermatophilus congolensis]MBO3142453.1 type I-E CRISPR-associated protein Cse2/CasB [Dermatophilus congolensis]MBO3151442.1 type I-E CRISPR-associated protein Cse2/CasB [Dermatophilus congolensis]MBO3161554.1 type I-E CRISPR-associated protein Cse2/CasB [Dermatophilus congolensis]MBO3162728.1 type I-E CRISPR-associated protein Cse2/CasB [Dermatophilus congolensis]MBO3176282.1 type I-E CRISPR-associated protein Cse2/CasB [Dermatophilus congolensi